MNISTTSPGKAGRIGEQAIAACSTAARGEPGMISPELKIRTILVPLDFSDASEKALAYAVPLARQFGAHITLLYVSDAQLHCNEFAYLPIEETAVEWAAQKRLQEIAGRMVPPDLLGKTEMRSGVPFDEVVAVAKELHADLIIVNTRGYTGLKHVLLGSTAERIVRHAPCPVLVVRERERDFA
jgi:universal stress protein A